LSAGTIRVSDVALALYRTYRPGSLAEVIGQEHVTGPLARALDSGRTHHAYLFSGPRGCGKTSTARILARSLNCEVGPTATPCGECRSCVELAPNGPGSMDVVELDAATHRGIDDARDLREKAIYAPAASRFKIYIIDEAHQLTNEAANALLKLVEEPPPHLRFIFATTEPDKIIPTIRSRTFHYGFRLVPARTLADHLGMVCRAEGVVAEAPALAIVARAGAGSVRDSLSVLGQLLAGAGPAGLTYADAISALGLTDTTLIDEFVAALSAGSAADMFGIVDVVISAGHDPRRFVTDVLDRLRDLIILRADHEALSKGLIDVPDDEGQRMVAQAQSLGLAELSRAADLVSAGLGQIKGATAPRLQLELLCARLALPGPGDDLSSVLARLDRLERGGSSAPASGQGAASVPAGESRRGPAPSSGTDGRSPQARADAVAEADAGAEAEVPRAPVPSTTPDPPARPTASSGAGSPPRRPELRRDAPAVAAAPMAADPALPVDPTSPPEPPSAALGEPSDPREPQGAANDASAAPGDETLITRIRDAWPAILERLAASSRVAWTAFHAATPVSCTNGALAVAVAEPGNVRAIAQRGHDERLRQTIIDVLALDLTIDVLHDPEPARPALTGTGVTGSAAASSTGSKVSSGTPGDAGATRSATGTGAGASRQATPPTARPADVVREAGSALLTDDVADEPSPDDPDLDPGGAQGLALITRELGARPIGEIDHS
jgi:DNA polymerase-3 subunit gamma/tau